MIAPESIDLLALPSVTLSDRSHLPAIAAVYLAIDGLGAVQYVGATKNLCQRWKQHHKRVSIARLESVRIAYLSCSIDLVEEIETALIEWFKPPLNQGVRRYGTICSPPINQPICKKPPRKAVMPKDTATTIKPENAKRKKDPTTGKFTTESEPNDKFFALRLPESLLSELKEVYGSNAATFIRQAITEKREREVSQQVADHECRNRHLIPVG